MNLHDKAPLAGSEHESCIWQPASLDPITPPTVRAGLSRHSRAAAEAARSRASDGGTRVAPEAEEGGTLPRTTNLPDEVWDWLLKDSEGFARRQIKKYRWRGARGGVLPRGFDANSIAAQAVLEFFQPTKDRSSGNTGDQTILSEGGDDVALSSPPKITLPEDPEDDPSSVEKEAPAPPEVPRPKSWDSECRKLQEELHHRVRRVVNRLWHLKERMLVHNLEDLVSVESDDSEATNFQETLPARDPDPRESLVEEEQGASQQQHQEEFHAFLRPERSLQNLYACLCAGISRRQHLARALKVTPREIKNRVRRLQRQAAAFLRRKTSDRMEEGGGKGSTQSTRLQVLAEAA